MANHGCSASPSCLVGTMRSYPPPKSVAQTRRSPRHGPRIRIRSIPLCHMATASNESWILMQRYHNNLEYKFETLDQITYKAQAHLTIGICQQDRVRIVIRMKQIVCSGTPYEVCSDDISRRKKMRKADIIRLAIFMAMAQKLKFNGALIYMLLCSGRKAGFAGLRFKNWLKILRC